MKRQIKYSGITWVDIKRPKEEDLTELGRQHHFHPLNLEECISPTFRSSIEEHEDYIFIVFHVPYFSAILETTVSIELNIFVTIDTIITVHQKGVEPIDQFFDNCQLHDQIREKNFGNGIGFLLYQIMVKILDSYLPKLGHISEHIDDIEQNIFKGREKEVVEKISLVRRDMIDFGKVIFPQEEIFKRVLQIKSPFFRPYDKKYFYNAHALYLRACDILNNNMEMIEALKDTNDSLLTHKLNQLIKILTLISAVFLPFTFIISLYQLDVLNGVPEWMKKFVLTPHFFNWSSIFSIAVIVVFIIIFKRKKWL